MSKIKLIEDLTNAFGPSGFEGDVVEIGKKYTKDFHTEVDAMNNFYINFKNAEKKDFKILLDAHSDEVGFIVQNINDNGTISFVNVGGWINSNIPAHLVNIKNTQGEIVQGITGSKPPHFMTDEEKASGKLNLEDMFIDIGANSIEEVINDYKIEIGCPIAPAVEFKIDEKGLMRGKAFDNRLGCAAIVETMKRLNGKDLFVEVNGAFATQEEVGMRGARVTTNKIKPDLAIVFEGSPADDLYYPKNQAQGALGAGTQIRHMDISYIGNVDYINFAKEIAKENNIKYQSTVRRGGGTNAGVIHLAHGGVPVLVLGIPSRYVHTHYNYAMLDDFNRTVELAVKLIENLNEENVKRILKK